MKKLLSILFIVVFSTTVLTVIFVAADKSHSFDSSQQWMLAFIAGVSMIGAYLTIHTMSYNAGLTDKEKEFESLVPQAMHEFKKMQYLTCLHRAQDIVTKNWNKRKKQSITSKQ